MNPDTVHKQLERLMRGGLSIDEACSALRNLGFTEREVRPIHTGVFRVTDVRLFHGGRVTNDIGRAAGPPRRSTASVEARSNSLPRDPDPLFRGWEKPPSRRWDKLISLGRIAWRVTLQVVTTVLVFAGLAFLVEHVNERFVFALLVFTVLAGQILGRTWARR